MFLGVFGSAINSALHFEGDEVNGILIASLASSHLFFFFSFYRSTDAIYDILKTFEYEDECYKPLLKTIDELIIQHHSSSPL